MLRPQEAIAAFKHRLDHRSETENKSNRTVIPTKFKLHLFSSILMVFCWKMKDWFMSCHFRFHSHILITFTLKYVPVERFILVYLFNSLVTCALTHLCLFSATLSSSQTSLECGERTTCTPHSSRTAMARSGPAIRASIRVRLSGLIFPPQSAEPLDQLLPFTPVTCSESPALLHCWDNSIKSFHSSKVWGSTPGKTESQYRH